MRLMKGNMWSSNASLILVTCNSFVRQDGALVMGRGAALEAKTKYPQFPYEMGKYVKQCSDGIYGVLFSLQYSNPELGVFQVKRHFRDDADLDLIQLSIYKFIPAIAGYPLVAMNMPGIGYGHLRRKQVLPLVKQLPDNVEVWEY